MKDLYMALKFHNSGGVYRPHEDVAGDIEGVKLSFDTFNKHYKHILYGA